jgi:hypothetical protein
MEHVEDLIKKTLPKLLFFWIQGKIARHFKGPRLPNLEHF